MSINNFICEFNNCLLLACKKEKTKSYRPKVPPKTKKTKKTRKKQEKIYFYFVICRQYDNIIQKLPEFAAITDEQDRKAKISSYLMPALEMHRKASMRWDFVSSENSTGFHFPDEAQRVLGQAKEMARRGQLELATLMQARGVTLALTSGSGIVPPAPTPLPKSDLH